MLISIPYQYHTGTTPPHQYHINTTRYKVYHYHMNILPSPSLQETLKYFISRSISSEATKKKKKNERTPWELRVSGTTEDGVPGIRYQVHGYHKPFWAKIATYIKKHEKYTYIYRIIRFGLYYYRGKVALTWTKSGILCSGTGCDRIAYQFPKVSLSQRTFSENYSYGHCWKISSTERGAAAQQYYTLSIIYGVYKTWPNSFEKNGWWCTQIPQNLTPGTGRIILYQAVVYTNY